MKTAYEQFALTVVSELLDSLASLFPVISPRAGAAQIETLWLRRPREQLHQNPFFFQRMCGIRHAFQCGGDRDVCWGWFGGWGTNSVPRKAALRDSFNLSKIDLADDAIHPVGKLSRNGLQREPQVYRELQQGYIRKDVCLVDDMSTWVSRHCQGSRLAHVTP